MQAQALKRLFKPFQFNQITFQPPPRPTFSLFSRQTFLQQIQSLWTWMRRSEFRRGAQKFNQGLQAHGLGQLQEAMEHYHQSLQFWPNHPGALINLAGVLSHMGRLEEATALLEEAILPSSFTLTQTYNLAILFLGQGKTERALEMLTFLESQAPNHFYIQSVRAEIHVNRNEHQAARAAYERALAQAPDPFSVMVRLGEIAFLSQEYQAAETYLRQVLEKRETPELLYNLAWSLVIQGKNLEEAAQLFLRARQKKANFPEALYNLALTESWLNHFEVAIDHMKRYCQRLHPDSLPDMIKHFRILARINPANHLAVMRITDYLYEQHHEEEAIAELKHLIKRVPDHCDALRKLAKMEFETGQFPQAEQTLETLLALKSEDGPAHILMSRIFCSQERFEEAMPHLEHALRSAPEDPELNYHYATLMGQKGQLIKALEHYKRVALRNPNFPRIQRRIRMIEEELREQD
jgi:tetratricopeptide (TPR) repeat protein